MGTTPPGQRMTPLSTFSRTGQLSDGAELWAISRTGNDERRIANLRSMYPIAHRYDVSARGEITYVRFDAGEHELWLTHVRAISGGSRRCNADLAGYGGCLPSVPIDTGNPPS